MDASSLIARTMLCVFTLDGHAVAQSASVANGLLTERPWVIGVMAGGGTAIADHVAGAAGRAAAILNFSNAGVRFGRVVNSPHGEGAFTNQLEISSELTPFWQAVYPRQQLVFHSSNGTQTDPGFGYTTRGVSLTPVQLRLEFVKHSKVVPWVQIGCGVLWTTRDFPTMHTASVNFTPQAGVGFHLFTRRRQSIDIFANAVHISNGNTADSNPGVNVTVQASLGYSWWFGGAR